MKPILLLSYIFTILFSGCKFSQSNKLVLHPYDNNCTHLLSGSKDSPKTYRYSDSILNCRLQLKSIRNGIFQKEIRIYIANSSTDSGRLILLKKYENTWSAELYYFRYFLNEKIAEGNYSLATNIIPDSGWDNFNITLNSQYLNNLKSPNNIENFEDCNCGDQITIEIADKISYSIFPYSCFWINKQLYEYTIVNDMIHYIEVQFHVNILGNLLFA